MLHFQGIQPIKFGDKEYQANLDNEKKLRLQTIKFDTAENIAYADDVLTSCFNEDEAKNFIREKLSSDDKEVLRTYLVRGETGLNQLSQATDKMIEKYMERAVNEK